MMNYKVFRSLVSGLLLVIFTCWLIMALLSYQIDDTSWLVYKSGNSAVRNICGSIGANVAAFMVYMFGLSSFTLLMFLFFCSYLLIVFGSVWYDIVRVIAYCFFVVTTAGLCTHYHVAYRSTVYTGGFIGYSIKKLFCGLTDTVLAPYLLWIVWLAMFIIIMRTLLVCTLRFILYCIEYLYRYRGCIVWILAYTFLGVTLMAHFLLYMVRYLYGLLSGVVIDGANISIVDFERGFHEQECQAILDDQCWRVYLTDIVTAKEQECGKNSINTVAYCNSVQQAEVYRLPSLSLLSLPSAVTTNVDHDDVDNRALLLQEKLTYFGVSGSVVAIHRGPVVTLFEYKPDIATRISKIIALEHDLSLALQALSVRIIAPIPGRAVVGFEVANNRRSTVVISSIFGSNLFVQSCAILPLAIGVDTCGIPLVADLAKMPHLLVAGSTGSGKSVALHTMLASLLFKKGPEDLKLVIIDPKRLEFAPYADIAHLLFPIIVESSDAIEALLSVVRLMEERYAIMARAGVRTILDYQARAQNDVALSPMPFIVILIDELADLMVTCGVAIQESIVRIAQMARACGIHMIVATQRPSVDVITGLIKINFASRIALRVASSVDSRTILDCGGAQTLLGCGDMLFLDAAGSGIKRLHGAYISDVEIIAIADYIRAQKVPSYLPFIITQDHAIQKIDQDVLYNDVVAFVHNVDEISISLLQRRFNIGYNRSARLVDTLEAHGIIMPYDGGKMRKVIHRQ